MVFRLLLCLVSGNFALPVKCLEPPPEEWLVRKCSKNIVDQLKQEMVDNTCTDVQPILCIVQLKRDETFNPLVKEGYKYNTIGGNHSRQALQELLSEKPELKSSKQFTHRTCSVYSAMDTILVRRLANKHNRAATHVHEITTMDWVRFTYTYSRYNIVTCTINFRFKYYFMKRLSCTGCILTL